MIVEAKRLYYTDPTLPQLTAYMGIVYTTRKEESNHNCVVYGASSNGRFFRFCRIDNNSKFVKSSQLEWSPAVDREKMCSIKRFLLRAAAPFIAKRDSQKDPMQRKIVLASFGSPGRSQE